MTENIDWIERAVEIFNQGVEHGRFTGPVGELGRPSNWQPVKTELDDRPNYEPDYKNPNRLMSECSYYKERHSIVGVKCPDGLNNRNDSWVLEYKLNICGHLIDGTWGKEHANDDVLKDSLYSQISTRMDSQYRKLL